MELKSYLEFLEFYLEGVLTEGSITPLRNFSARKNDLVSKDINLVYDLQIQGHSPQKAFQSPMLSMPSELKRLISLGFEKSSLDLVLERSIKLIKESSSAELLRAELNALHNKFSNLNTEAICLGCAEQEFEKILVRAEMEKAKEVLIKKDGDFIVQIYLGPKLITIREAAIHGVYQSLKDVYDKRRGRVQISFQ